MDFDPNKIRYNKQFSILIDRTLPGFRYYTGTGIVIIHIRPRKDRELTKYSKELAPGWIVDYDENDQPMEIEILNPTKHFPKEILDILPSEFTEVQEDGKED